MALRGTSRFFKIEMMKKVKERIEEDRKEADKYQYFGVGGGIYKSFEEGVHYLDVQSARLNRCGHIFETVGNETEGNHLRDEEERNQSNCGHKN